jgi:DNA polymerase III delta subunit
VEKLLTVVLANGEKRISDELVDDIVYPDTEYKIYELSNALSSKNYTQFMKIATELKGKGYDELSLLSNLCFHFRDVYDVAKSVGTDKEVANALNMREYAVKKNRMIASKIGAEKVGEYYQMVFDAITGIKSGGYTPSSAWQLVVGRLFFS